MKLVQVSYEQCRLEFFEEQLAAAKRKLDYAVNRNYPFDVCASRGDVVAFYEWAVEKAQQEIAADNNVGSKWIPVTDRLPVKRFFVLVFTSDKMVGEAILDNDGRFYWANTDEDAEPLDVTHWMPLPEPPKEVE